jgi:hypothetical protein
LVKKNRLGICDKCAQFENKLRQSLTAPERKIIDSKRSKHLRQVKEGLFNILFFL